MTAPVETFEFLEISCESSERDTDPEGFGEAIRAAFGELVEDVYIPWVDDSCDDEDDGRIPNYGQYSQPIEFTFTRPVTMAEFDAIMETVDGGSFGFGNGWDL